MKSIEIKGSLRTETGKKATRELRKDNGIPCVLYGTQKDENGNQVYYESGKMQGKPKFAVKHHRRKENLSLYLIDKPHTPAE